MTQPKPVWRPYTQEMTAAPPVKLARAENAHLITENGQRILDGVSSWWLITHGHCHPAIVEAVRNQAVEIDQVLFANFTHAPAEELAELLMRMTPAELTRVFFTDNGSTAVEAALKMALQASAQMGAPKKHRFIAFEGAYHGDTVGAMSVGAESVFNRAYKPMLFDVIRAKFPDGARDGESDFSRLLEEHHLDLAGVILEPLVQGAGGMLFWPEASVREVAALCKRYGVFLIFDEVMTGFGRTGALFAMNRIGIAPDLVCLSKGLTGGTLPLAATLVSEKIYSAFLSSEKQRMLFHGHSFTANPLACAAAVANLKLFLEPSVERQLSNIEAAHRRGLGGLRRRDFVINPRVLGSIGAFDLCDQNGGYLASFSTRLTELALNEGVFVRPLGSTVYLMPPYCTSPSAVESAWELLGELVEPAVALAK